MARGAIARLYDVDEDSVEFIRLTQTGDYDQGRVIFRAHEGRLVDLDKLHESVWATRLSGRTSSGLVSLDVTTIGRIENTEQGLMLHVEGSDADFIIERNPEGENDRAFEEAASSSDDTLVQVTGRIADYRGRWPLVLRNQPENPRRIWITEITPSSELP